MRKTKIMLIVMLVAAVVVPQGCMIVRLTTRPSPFLASAANTNVPPVADLSAGEPYQGFVGESLVFDGSKSADLDGHLVKWYWTFGDGYDGSGKVITYAYMFAGTYPVVLTVTDNKGATATDEASVVILNANTPPSQPMVTGGPGEDGQKLVAYNFQVMSSDPDNNDIRYSISWGDGAPITTDPVASGVSLTQSHAWSFAGRYTVMVKASDGSTESSPTSVDVLINAAYVGEYGYLVDTNGDSVFDLLRSNVTGSFTGVKHQSDGTYLVETNGDGSWDYQFNPQTKALSAYVEAAPMSSSFLVLGGVVLLVVILIVVMFLLSRRKKTPASTSEQPEEPMEAEPPEATESVSSAEEAPEDSTTEEKQENP
jgi:hypothetical protein